MPEVKAMIQHPAVHHSLIGAFVLTEISHVFCCILPTVITVISVMASLGIVIQMPSFMMGFHHLIHAYEIPVMTFSGAMLALGWGAQALSTRLACESPLCDQHAGPKGDTCTPHKHTMRRALIAASVLFTINVLVYVTLHRGMDADMHTVAQGQGQGQEQGHMHHAAEAAAGTKTGAGAIMTSPAQMTSPATLPTAPSAPSAPSSPTVPESSMSMPMPDHHHDGMSMDMK